MTWLPKPGPLLRRGRIVHALIGALLTSAAATVAGEEGAAVACVCTAAIGLVWEYLTPVLYPGSWHPHGDFRDWLAFVVGGLVGMLTLLLKAG